MFWGTNTGQRQFIGFGKGRKSITMKYATGLEIGQYVLTHII